MVKMPAGADVLLSACPRANVATVMTTSHCGLNEFPFCSVCEALWVTCAVQFPTVICHINSPKQLLPVWVPYLISALRNPPVMQ